MAKGKKNGSRRVKTIAILLCVLCIAALATYRYFKTESGRVFLLDIGFDSRFESVQGDIGKRIVRSLRHLGVRSDHVKVVKEKRPGGGRVALLRAETPPDASLIQMNSAVSRSVREIGGRVRSCREGKDGSVITMDIGTRRILTHRCVIVKGAARDREAHEKESMAPVVALCVDDFGFFRNDLVKDFLSLEIPLTISVIPGLKYTERICREAAEAGKDVICHVPMEAEKGAWDNGEIPLIRVSMNGRDIEKVLVRALETAPGAIGMNNHMGSKATTDRKVMEAVLRVCRDRRLYFFDSITTSHSVARRVAREMGVPTAGNDLFIDNVEGEARDNIRKLLSIAEQRGSAIGIVHVRESSLEDVRWMIDEAQREGIRFITISELIMRHNVKVAEGGP